MSLPIKTHVKEKEKQLNRAIDETLEVMKSATENNPRKDILDLMRGDMKQGREHEFRKWHCSSFFFCLRPLLCILLFYNNKLKESHLRDVIKRNLFNIIILQFYNNYFNTQETWNRPPCHFIIQIWRDAIWGGRTLLQLIYR